MDSNTAPADSVSTGPKTAQTGLREAGRKITIGGREWSVNEDGKIILAFGISTETAERLNRLIDATGSTDVWDMLRNSLKFYAWFKECIGEDDILAAEDVDGKTIFKIPARVFSLIE